MEMTVYNEKNIIEQLKKYEGIIPSGDKQDLKKVKADLNKIEKVVKNYEKEQIDPLKEKISRIKDSFLGVKEEIAAVKKPIEEMIKEIEEDEKKKKLEEIKEYINKNHLEWVGKLDIKPEYLNLSKSMSSIKNDLERRIEDIKTIEKSRNYVPTLQLDIRITAKEDVMEQIIELLKEKVEFQECARRIKMKDNMEFQQV